MSNRNPGKTYENGYRRDKTKNINTCAIFLSYMGEYTRKRDYRRGEKEKTKDKAGSAFERYVADLFKSAGYNVRRSDIRLGPEVDVYVEGDKGKITIIECKDYSRPVNWEIISKFVYEASTSIGNRKVDEAIVVSQSGFTPACYHSIEEMTKKDISLMTLSELEDHILNIDTIRRSVEGPMSTLKNTIPYFGEDSLRVLLQGSIRDKSSSPKNIGGILYDWLIDDTSNFAVILGEFGSGKTTTLINFFDEITSSFSKIHWRTPIFLEYKEIIGHTDNLMEYIIMKLLGNSKKNFPILNSPDRPGIKKHFIFIFDGYDEVSLFGSADILKEPISPNLLQIKPLLTPDSKVIIACRRSFMSADSELIDQLNDPKRLKRFGINNPYIVEIQPLEEEDIKNSLDPIDEKKRDKIQYYFKKKKFIDIPYFRRPLFLEMISELDFKDMESTITVNKLYTNYIDHVLTKDSDQGSSRIPRGTKEEILTNLAADIFNKRGFEKSSSEQNIESRHGMRIKLKNELSGLPDLLVNSVPDYHIGIRVMESVSNYCSRGHYYHKSTFMNYNWTNDFLMTNHFLYEIPPQDNERRFKFIHSTFYEYFLASHFISVINSGKSIGIKDEHVNEGIFDSSLLLYFIKYRLTEDHIFQLRQLASEERMHHQARALAIYLLEDEPDILNILKSVPYEYKKYIEMNEKTSSSPFLKKMYKYQLALIGNDMQKGFEYVDFLREMERALNTELELSMFSVEYSPTEFLLKRWTNPNLEAVRPITAYRLSQFGDRSALKQLKADVKKLKNNQKLQNLVKETIKKIEQRNRDG